LLIDPEAFFKQEFLVKQFFFSHPSIFMSFNQTKAQKPRECHPFPDSTPWKLGHVNVNVSWGMLLRPSGRTRCGKYLGVVAQGGKTWHGGNC